VFPHTFAKQNRQLCYCAFAPVGRIVAGSVIIE
jgi:Zn-finger protein